MCHLVIPSEQHSERESGHRFHRNAHAQRWHTARMRTAFARASPVRSGHSTLQPSIRLAGPRKGAMGTLKCRYPPDTGQYAHHLTRTFLKSSCARSNISPFSATSPAVSSIRAAVKSLTSRYPSHITAAQHALVQLQVFVAFRRFHECIDFESRQLCHLEASRCNAVSPLVSRPSPRHFSPSLPSSLVRSTYLLACTPRMQHSSSGPT